MQHLAAKRPVFHSEADFQHALAWELHERYPHCSLRLEYKPPHLNAPIYLDMWVHSSETTLAIELKYKTRAGHLEFEGESFDLLHHGAQPLGRYDFLKDVERLEHVVAERSRSLLWGSTQRNGVTMQ